jgi:hypothetical protein
MPCSPCTLRKRTPDSYRNVFDPRKRRVTAPFLGSMIFEMVLADRAYIPQMQWGQVRIVDNFLLPTFTRCECGAAEDLS